MRLPPRSPVGPGAVPSRVLVACIGNGLVADDAVGCAVYERLGGARIPEGIRVELLAVGGLRLLDALQGEEALVVVDAVHLGAPPGTLHVLEGDRIPESPGPPVTAHGFGVGETIAVGRLLGDGPIPGRIVLVGIESRRFDGIGMPMTPEVAAAVQPAADEVLRRARALLAGGGRRAPRHRAAGSPGSGPSS